MLSIHDKKLFTMIMFGADAVCVIDVKMGEAYA